MGRRRYGHGRVIFRGYLFDLAQVQQLLGWLISQGHVVMTYKTKWRESGGRQLVSVGPHRQAVRVPGRNFALIDGSGDTYYANAHQAAGAFIEFVGRNLAREAAKEAMQKAGGFRYFE